jgi:hypothetical protein
MKIILGILEVSLLITLAMLTLASLYVVWFKMLPDIWNNIKEHLKNK